MYAWRGTYIPVCIYVSQYACINVWCRASMYGWVCRTGCAPAPGRTLVCMHALIGLVGARIRADRRLTGMQRIAHTHAYIHAHMHAYKQEKGAHTHTYKHIHNQSYARTHKHTPNRGLHTRIHTHMRTYMYTHAHIQANI